MLVVIFCKCMIWFSAGVSGSLPDRYMTWTLPLLLTSWTAMSWAVTSLSLYRKKCHAMPVAFFHDTAWSINQSETTFEMWCVIKHVHSYNSLLEVSVMLCQLASWLFPSYWMINQSGTKESEHFLAKFPTTCFTVVWYGRKNKSKTNMNNLYLVWWWWVTSQSLENVSAKYTSKIYFVKYTLKNTLCSRNPDMFANCHLLVLHAISCDIRPSPVCLTRYLENLKAVGQKIYHIPWFTGPETPTLWKSESVTDQPTNYSG